MINPSTKFEDPVYLSVMSYDLSVLELPVRVLTLMYGGNSKHDLDNIGYRSR